MNKTCVLCKAVTESSVNHIFELEYDIEVVITPYQWAFVYPRLLANELSKLRMIFPPNALCGLQRAVHDRDMEIIESQFDVASDLEDHLSDANASDDSGDEVCASVTYCSIHPIILL